MSEHEDLLNMIEIVNCALEIQGRTEDSFRRSAGIASTEVARGLSSEIADDFGKYRERLQTRKQKILGALYHLRSVERNGDEKCNDLVAQYCVEQSKPHPGTYEKNDKLNIAHDLVCDMQVNEEECQYVSVYRGEKYFFCCEDCQMAFDFSPQKYLKEQPAKFPNELYAN